jgi:hypothetical protein
VVPEQAPIEKRIANQNNAVKGRLILDLDCDAGIGDTSGLPRFYPG